jgi:DNA-binding MarR family transcriptional regulator
MSKAISSEQASILKRFYAALAPFRGQRETMPLQYVEVFLLVAADEGRNFSTYATRIGSSQSLMSRHVADLGSVNRYHTEGLGLLETYDDLMDRRNKLIRLTAKGRHIAWKITEAFART